MNQLQSAAYLEGQNQIATAFRSRQSLDTPTLSNWINICLAKDSTVEQSVQLIDRDDAGNLARTTTLNAGRSELCGYRLAGAFAAVESFRAALDRQGITFNAIAPHE